MILTPGYEEYNLKLCFFDVKVKLSLRWVCFVKISVIFIHHFVSDLKAPNCKFF